MLYAYIFYVVYMELQTRLFNDDFIFYFGLYLLKFHAGHGYDHTSLLYCRLPIFMLLAVDMALLMTSSDWLMRPMVSCLHAILMTVFPDYSDYVVLLH